jgi:hypothetical protein
MAVAVSVSIFSREREALKVHRFSPDKTCGAEKNIRSEILGGLTVIIAANIVFIIALVILYIAGGA